MIRWAWRFDHDITVEFMVKIPYGAANTNITIRVEIRSTEYQHGKNYTHSK